MALSSLDIPQLRENLKNFQFNKLFVESLGWEYPIKEKTSGTIKFENNIIPYSYLFEKSGVFVLQFNQRLFNQFNGTFDKQTFHPEIKKQKHKNIC